MKHESIHSLTRNSLQWHLLLLTCYRHMWRHLHKRTAILTAHKTLFAAAEGDSRDPQGEAKVKPATEERLNESR